MKLQLVKVGKVGYDEISSLIDVYETRLKAFCKFERIELRDNDDLIKFYGKPTGDHVVVALDERGKEFGSRDFAGWLTTHRDDPGVKTLSFVIGGPHGLPPEIKQNAKLLLRLSKLTFTSDLAWLLLWEQLYRAQNIIAGTGYHHD